jgi:hypothetical protein
MQHNSIDLQVIAHHEAGHALAGVVLGVGFLVARITPGEDGRIGVPFESGPWVGPRPVSNPGEFTEEQWSFLSQDDARWEQWKKGDNEHYAIFCLAGKAAQLEFAGMARDEDAKADYSFVEYRLPNCYQRLRELEQAARDLVQEHWAAVQAVAAELMNRSALFPYEVERIVQRTMGKT